MDRSKGAIRSNILHGTYKYLESWHRQADSDKPLRMRERFIEKGPRGIAGGVGVLAMRYVDIDPEVILKTAVERQHSYGGVGHEAIVIDLPDDGKKLKLISVGEDDAADVACRLRQDLEIAKHYYGGVVEDADITVMDGSVDPTKETAWPGALPVLKGPFVCIEQASVNGPDLFEVLDNVAPYAQADLVKIRQGLEGIYTETDRFPDLNGHGNIRVSTDGEIAVKIVDFSMPSSPTMSNFEDWLERNTQRYQQLCDAIE